MATQGKTSHVAAVTYANDTLRVTFDNGKVYEYYGIPESLYKNWEQDGFSGKFLNQVIKGKYRYSPA